MKRPVLFIVTSIMLTLGCQENDTPVGNVDDLSSFAREFLGIKSINSVGPAAARNQNTNMAFRGAINSYASIAGGSVPGIPSDSSIIDPGPGGWLTCATITETQNPDGSTTITTDYGDGCEEGFGEWKYFMFGKNTNTYRYTNSQNGSVYSYDYQNRYKSEHFGSKYYLDMDNDGSLDTAVWISDGSSNFSGQSSYDTISHAISGHFIYSDTSSYSYNEQSYSFKSRGQSFHDSRKSTVAINDYEYRNGPDYYSSHVLIPLVTDYMCFMGMATSIIARPFWAIYVSGREKVTYSKNGQSGEFEIDYGAGECDNIITIYENGKIIRIDLLHDLPALVKGG